MEMRRPMLAAKATDSELQALFTKGRSFLLSPKIDGIRALVVNGQLVSRTMKPIRNMNTQQRFSFGWMEGFDGELVVGNPHDKNLMQQTSSGVMSISGNPEAKFYVFDKWNEKGIFEQRLHQAHCDIEEYDSRSVVPLVHHLIKTEDEMLFWERAYVNQGYEGVMLRSLDGPYKQNRSTLKEGYLVKVKRFVDAEAVITGYEPLYRNLNSLERDERGYAKRSHSQDGKVADETLGKVYVTDLDTGVSFSVGSGFTEAQRQALWLERHSGLVGRLIKYKSFKNAGVKDAPRHPIFLGFRDKDDM